MIIIFIAVGSNYTQLLLSKLDSYLELGYPIEILTDSPSLFSHKKVNVTKYEDSIFNYVDKFLFLFRKIKEHKQNGFLVDVTKLNTYTPSFLTNSVFKDIVIFSDYWKDKNTFFEAKNNPMYATLWEWIENTDIHIPPLLKLKFVFEGLCYFPYVDTLDQLIIELEKLKIIFSSATLTNSNKNLYTPRYKSTNPPVGYGEGILITLLLYMFHIEYIVLKDYSPTTHKGIL